MFNALKKAKNDCMNNEVLCKRIRLPVKNIYRNEQEGEKLSKFVSSIKGVVSVKANPITGRILVIYDEELVHKEIIKKQIYQYLATSKPVENANVVKLNRTNFLEETALPIAVEKELLEENKVENNTIKQKTIEYNVEGNVITDLFNTNNQCSYWHCMDREHIRKVLNTDYQKGLSEKVYKQRIHEVGLNVLTEKKKKSLFKKFFDGLNEISNRLLIGVSTASLFLGQVADAVAIMGIVLVETTLSIIQEHKAEKSIYSLKSMMVQKARVIRSGVEKEIDAGKLVPGDVILLEAGDKIPADCRLIQCNDLRVSEAELTGESKAISKSIKECSKDTELANRKNMLFMGTNVLCGRGKAVVVETGMKTEIGKIAAMLQNIKNELTPLQRRLFKFSSKITKVCLGVCLGLGGVGLLMGMPLAQVLTVGTSFAVGALPESLPAIVTIAMGLSVQRLAKKNAIIRKLNAVETLGSANVICCDKTGTLTMNEMTVKRLYADKCLYSVSGSGYEPSGNIKLLDGYEEENDALKMLLTDGVLCNNALLVQDDSGKWNMEGDPTEGALIAAAYKAKLDVQGIINRHKRLKEIPFDSIRKNMIVLVEDDENKTVYIKGALDKIINKCTSIYENGHERLFTTVDKERIMKVCNEMSDDALRVLAFAYKKVNSKKDDMYNNYVFLGLAGMEDPPRKGVNKAMKKCHRAGIKVVMITGDHKNTAAAIGKQLGLLDGGLVVSGSELAQMSDEELDEKIVNIQVFARTSPEQKLRIVKAFKRFGYVVAMTGDGVNDAPAIKEANIGIAMGGNGSDVAKDAADITLVDDNFLTIVNAVEEGRTVTNNIRNTMKYLLAGSLGEILAIGAAAAVSGTLPLLSIQILWTNVICETILGASLAVEPVHEKIMKKRPIRNDTKLIDNKLGTQILRRGGLIGATSFAVFGAYNYLGVGLAKARTMAFSNLILTQLANVYRCRDNKDLSNNRYMNISVGISAALLLGILYIPPISGVFRTVALNPLDWAVLSGMTAVSQI